MSVPSVLATLLEVAAAATEDYSIDLFLEEFLPDELADFVASFTPFLTTAFELMPERTNRFASQVNIHDPFQGIPGSGNWDLPDPVLGPITGPIPPPRKSPPTFTDWGPGETVGTYDPPFESITPSPSFGGHGPVQLRPDDPSAPSQVAVGTYMDGDVSDLPPRLIGIEPNPGPRPSQGKKNKKKAAKKQRQGKNVTPMAGSIRSSAAPAAVAAGRPATWVSSASSTYLGVRSTVYRGTMFCLSLASMATGSNMEFLDPAGNNSLLLYLNPRIICQAANYGTPSNTCAIQLYAGAFRNFVFTKLRFRYQPLAASTSDLSSFALAYVPDPIITLPGGLTQASLASVESSTFGPTWMTQAVDTTPFLIKNRWFTCEIPALDTTNTEVSEQIQGSLIVIGQTTTASHTYGFLYADFEIHFAEMGSIKLISTPSYLVASKVKSLVNSDSDEKKEVPSSSSIVKRVPALVAGSAATEARKACSTCKSCPDEVPESWEMIPLSAPPLLRKVD